ncbi:hypothetical protein F8O01_14230 [Pseudoclavibacter chungangensis]|uniref:Uncharacterized protein n=1 Tax=Pseudoclavibacter chungangensis TaxID=587635 RepID=A0A7J5BNY2_9MICO|nr:hypothetical protein [Pseudoclavibacter chungangensis]KAB1654068.1 hypothetical protein F8O01_14230 [Pseudoclavibacter chungangensis]NYJ66020.1 hypothetical protein [Pseudoclavibacter chungangensis]
MSDGHGLREMRSVGLKQGQVVWARETINVLRETATTFDGVITHPALIEEVQERTRLSANAQPRTWLNTVLAIVAIACHERELPPLTALAIRAHDGRVGPFFDEALRVEGHAPATDEAQREQLAAEARLRCYLEFCDDVPEDARPNTDPGHRRPRTSGTAASRPRQTTATAGRDTTRATAASPSTSTRSQQPAEPVVALCPTCFIQLPVAGGACPNCD